MSLEVPAWHDAAACRDSELDFFPARGGDYRSPRLVCATCPVRTDCLAYALEHKIAHGVWGGSTESERKKMRALPLRRTCEVCRAPYESRHGYQVTCSKACAAARHNQQRVASYRRRRGDELGEVG